jgi:hypothetical protein
MTEDSLIDARAIDNGIGQVSIGQVSLTEFCAREIGTIEESARQLRPAQVSFSEIGQE